jgi:hypothetical protein
LRPSGEAGFGITVVAPTLYEPLHLEERLVRVGAEPVERAVVLHECGQVADRNVDALEAFARSVVIRA